MYQNLSSNLNEWKNRLYETNIDQANDNFNFFFDNITANKKLNSIIQILNNKFPDDQVKSRGLANIKFENEDHRISLIYKVFLNIRNNGRFLDRIMSLGLGFTNYNQLLPIFFKSYVEHFVNYLNDHLEDDNSMLYLLEKYKKRTEWFTKDVLLKKYTDATASYEKLLQEDLRLFLFDQGIENPFSPSDLPSGRPDTVANLDTQNPLVLEIKIYNKQKRYEKNRIKEGFKQIVSYSNDLNKNTGYLVVFSLDQIVIDYKFNNLNNQFPPCLEFNNKFYYFITVNLNFDKSACVNNFPIVTITENDLIK